MQKTLCGVMVVFGIGSEDDKSESVLGKDDEIKIADEAGAEEGVKIIVVEIVAFGVSIFSAAFAGVAAVERRRSCASHDSEPVWSSSRIRLPSSFTFPRVMTTFRRPVSGRNLEGMLSHVFLPMIKAFKAPGGADSGTLVVSFLKNAISPLIPDHGRVPRLPIPMEGFSAVATIT